MFSDGRTAFRQPDTPDSASASAVCGTPTASIIDGFPVAPCGDNVDDALDDAIGYLPFDDENYSASLQSFAPGLGNFGLGDYQDNIIGQNDSLVEGPPLPPVNTSSLAGRGLSKQKRSNRIQKRVPG